MICRGCGQDDELRYGYCFPCATEGERRAAQYSVTQHCIKGFSSLVRGYRTEARIYFRWAWERLTRAGDYAPGGEFERIHGVQL